jgi:nucleotide-binding universal stress UspA family protein
MLSIHTILFPTDFSDSAQAAFPFACSFARDCGARVVVLHVMPDPLYGEQLEARRHPEEYFAPARKLLHEMRAPDEDVHVEYRQAQGDAASVIFEVAKEVQAGLIVMGTHGRTGLARLLLGSVAERVVREAACPVLTLKSPALLS